MGGALFSDGDVEMHANNVTQNVALGKKETATGVPSYAGNGGAFYITRGLKLYNTLVVNNEASKLDAPADGGRGMLYLGAAATLEMANNNFVRNKATDYAAIYAAAPTDTPSRHVYNTVFWGNEGAEKVVNDAANVNLWFSAYEAGKGPAAVDADNDATFAEAPVTDLAGKNGNIIISSTNDDSDGPNFVNPSPRAGVADYTPTANWSPRRINLLTDAGWGGLSQEAKVGTTFGANNEADYEVTFYPNAAETKGYYIKRANDKPADLYKGADLTTQYMKLNIGGTGLSALRIAKDPSPAVKKTYVDIGVCEYQQIQLKMQVGADVDTLWVSTTEKLENGLPNGSSWRQPTADLQRAIETLLASRNGHQKLIYLIEGTYAPVRTVSTEGGNKLLAFTINTKSLDEAVTSRDPSRGVGSLTIRGGWSADVPNTQNVEAYPTILKMQRHAGMLPEQYAHLLYIEDATNRINKGADAEVKGSATFPILIEGVSFVNELAPETKQGAAIYFKKQVGKGKGASASPVAITGTTPALVNDGLEKNGTNWTYINPRKIDHRLMLNRTQFYLNKGESAVRVEEGGGQALVVNSLFHSNAGTGLDATNTVVLNSTFALNKQGVKLEAASSHLYNSILWRNTVKQYDNAGGELKHNAITGITTDATNNNVALSDVNDDIQTGPNFVDPNHADAAKRNFHVRPSLTILNKGDNATYIGIVYPAARLAAEAELKALDEYQNANPKPLTMEIVGNAPATDVMRQYEYDLGYRQRIYGSAIERGAYESNANVRRVVYVDPTRVTPNDTYDGTSWQKAYTMGELQSAINIAAMYSAQNANGDAENAKSYVFVKQGMATGAITMLDGVQLYGSLSSIYHTEVVKTGTTPENYVWSNDALLNYIKQVKDDRAALASPTSTPSYLESLTATGTLTTGVLVDGVALRGAHDRVVDVPTAPLRLAADAAGTGTAVLRNTIVYHFNATQGAVAEVSGGLLYNVLFRNSSGHDGVVHLSDGGRMLNCTVVAEGNGVAVKAEGATPLVAKSITANATDNIASSRQGTAFATARELSNNTAVAQFAPYFKAQLYTAVFGQRPNLNYQLLETSDDIDQTTDAVDPFLTNAMKSAVDYASDLDLLKNPRKLGDKVDRGAFETWTTKKGSLTVGGTSHTYVVRSHHYPHEGSVMYAMAPSKGFVVDATNPPAEPICPGYFLLQKGGWYGGGKATLQLAYAALDRKVEQEHLLVSLPFAMAYGKDDKLEAVATYDGAARSASKYKAVTDNSTLWKPLVAATTVVPANQGVYAHFKDFAAPTTHRFTSVAANNLNTYVYEETAAKKVTLTQYNATPTDGSAAYTPLENMGWNLFGQPYMVSDYLTGGAADANHAYPMNIPHVLTRLQTASAAYESFNSWGIATYLRAGEGVFTQTATHANAEELHFRLPQLAVDGLQPTQRKMLTLATDRGEDQLTLLPDAQAERRQFTIGGNAVKWAALDERLPQLSVADGEGRYSLLSAVPLATDLPLAVSVGAATELRFSLPDREAYAAHDHVWLTDRATQTVVDLLVDDYAVAEGADYADASRFALRFGGERPQLTPVTGTTHKMRTVQGRLSLSLPVVAARIEVFDPSGRLVHRDEHTDRLQLSLPDGVYIVRTAVE